MASFTLAVDRRFKNKDGQKEADFVPIVVWGKQAEFAGQYLSKGSQISLSGRLQVSSYDAQDGQRRYITEVVADEINFLSTTKNKGQNTQNHDPANDLDEDFHLLPDDDPDDIPF